jgi:hypothetical protein
MSIRVLILNDTGVGWLPTLLGPDGTAFREALCWTRSEFDQPKSPTTLRLEATALAKYVVYWDKLRASLLGFIDEERSELDAEIKWPRLQTVLAKIRAACEYLEIKPNFWGLGPNLNRVLEPKVKNTSRG